jgi:hypothetical protein
MRIVPESLEEHRAVARRIHAIRHLLGEDFPITIEPPGSYPLTINPPDRCGTTDQTPDA